MTPIPPRATSSINSNSPKSVGRLPAESSSDSAGEDFGGLPPAMKPRTTPAAHAGHKPSRVVSESMAPHWGHGSGWFMSSAYRGSRIYRNTGGEQLHENSFVAPRVRI